MRIPGARIKRTRLIQTEQYTVRFLREVKERAERGEVAWLTQHGKVYAAVAA